MDPRDDLELSNPVTKVVLEWFIKQGYVVMDDGNGGSVYTMTDEGRAFCKRFLYHAQTLQAALSLGVKVEEFKPHLN